MWYYEVVIGILLFPWSLILVMLVGARMSACRHWWISRRTTWRGSSSRLDKPVTDEAVIQGEPVSL